MRRIPWRLSVRFSRKGAVTVLGIALGVAFALVSFSVAGGLEKDTLGIARNYPARSVAVFPAEGGELRWSDVAAVPGILGVAVGEGTDARGRSLRFFAIHGEVGDEARVQPGSARTDGDPLFPLFLEGRSFSTSAGVAPAFVPRGAALVATDDMPGGGELLDHALLREPAPETVDALRAQGYRVEGAPKLQEFFTVSGAEVARDLLLVVVFSSILAMLFCYEFLRSEVRESRREIGIWRAVGMRASDVVALFLARAFAIGATALWTGWGMAMLILGLAHDRIGNAIFRFDLEVGPALLICSAFLLATMVGGLVPAIVASRITVQRSLESAG